VTRPTIRCAKMMKLCLFLAVVVLVTGCTHLGPKTIALDRFDYSTAIADSWKQQTLLNIVKLRYMDLPVFVDVSSIVAGYSMQTGVSVNGTLSSEKAIQGNYLAAGGQAIYTDRPTITYVPLTGENPYSPVCGAENELAVNSRSMLQIMGAFASYLDVPEADLKEHRAVPGFENALPVRGTQTGAPESRRDGVRIHSGKEKPEDAFAAVRYRDHWFWIDDGDWQTKRALTAVMFFFTLAETGGNEKLPLITIPAQ
jgi:hypothetical protein